MSGKKPLQEPIYDDRVNATIKGLSAGRSRNDLAMKFGLSSWKSLDIYMRRKGFTWDSEKFNYTPVIKTAKKPRKSVSSNPSKAQQIIQGFEQQVDMADPRSIAKELGFSNHREMAAYMEGEGFVWNSEKGNYTETHKPSKKPVLPPKKQIPTKEISPRAQSKKDVPLPVKELARKLVEEDSEPNSKTLYSYLPLLELLTENQDRLIDLLVANPETHMPKYDVHGAPKTKSIYMSELLSQLISEFSEEKNVSQRTIVETALIQYLDRYGYQSQVGKLLAK